MSRIILKLSGEALAGPKGKGFDLDTVKMVAGQVLQLVLERFALGLVVVQGGDVYGKGPVVVGDGDAAHGGGQLDDADVMVRYPHRARAGPQ